jgi:nucleoredoxin
MKISKILPALILSSILCLQAKAEQKRLSPELEDLFQGPLLDSQGKEVSKKMLGGKTIGIYFSAHWCPPCRSFTPKLVKFRDANKKDFEVVFVSSDKSPKAQMDYMKGSKMKWYTLPHRSDTANKLSKKFGVRGIPALIIVSDKGETITKNGRGDVSGNPEGAIKNWQKKS